MYDFQGLNKHFLGDCLWCTAPGFVWSSERWHFGIVGDAVNVTQHQPLWTFLWGWSKFDPTLYHLYAIQPLAICSKVPPSLENTGPLLIPEPYCEKTTVETKCGFFWWLALVNIPYTCPDSSMLVRPRTFGCLGKLSDCWEKKNERVRQRDEERGRRRRTFALFQRWADYGCKWHSLISKFFPLFFC